MFWRSYQFTIYGGVDLPKPFFLHIVSDEIALAQMRLHAVATRTPGDFILLAKVWSPPIDG